MVLVVTGLYHLTLIPALVIFIYANIDLCNLYFPKLLKDCIVPCLRVYASYDFEVVCQFYKIYKIRFKCL